MPRQRTNPLDRPFWGKIVVGDCWEWTGYIAPNGYGQVGFDYRLYKVHRLVWEILVGPVEPGLDLDHLCRVRHCCNPDHLEPVTRSVNLRRGLQHIQAEQKRAAHRRAVVERRKFCKRGHPLLGGNLYMTPDGRRQCRNCMRLRSKGGHYPTSTH